MSQDNELQVVGCAANTTYAMTMLNELKPDMMVLDIEMPGVSGIDFLKQLIPSRPIPIVVISSLPSNALDALSAGAIDFVNKPTAGETGGQRRFMEELAAKIKMSVTAKICRPVVESPRIKQEKTSIDMLKKIVPLTPLVYTNTKGTNGCIITIGASTGGTEAILTVIKDLPENTPGIIIVQHMPPVFTGQYAKRADKICMMSVKEAVDYDRVVAGQVIIAAGDAHITLKKDSKGYYIRSIVGEKVSGHCPSVDVMFESVAAVAGCHAIGVILTGMGADGAKGMKKMHQTGAYTIGQDKDSSIVYGMPMEAFKLGAVTAQLPLDKISAEIMTRCKLNI